MFSEHANKYLKQGFSVFPALSNKKPAILTWTPYQTQMPTPEEIDRWSKDLNDPNIAIACGKISDLTVVDADSPAAIKEIEALLPEQCKVPIVHTPRGGRHYYFKYCPDLKSRKAARPKIDIKSKGGYVLAPPSKTENGTYSWNRDLNLGTVIERPTVPEALLTLLKAATISPVLSSPDTPILAQGTRDQDLFHAALQLFKDGRRRDEVERIVVNMAKVCTPPFSEREAGAKVESAWRRIQSRSATLAGSPGEDEDAILAERDPCAVKARSIPWLWPGVIPTHMATAITGDAGQGKSLVAVDMTARVSRRKAFPVYDKTAPPVQGHVFYVTSEGVPEMILVPRLIAAGADLSKITIIEGIYQKNGDFSMFDVTQHLPKLKKRAKDFPDLRMTIIDPIASFLPERISPNQQNQVRQAMDKISRFAYETGTAALTIMHFAKASGIKAIHKTSGSVQFEASVKMSWSVIRKEGDPRNVRLLVPQKSNITGGYKSIAFAIREVTFPAPGNPHDIITTAAIEYGELVDEDPETLISPPEENDNYTAKACRFLSQKLKDGTTLYAVPLIDEAESNGIPKWALYKAKDRLGVAHDKESQFQGHTFWFMPKEKTPCP